MKRGKVFFALEFQTRQLSCFNEIYTLFYLETKIKTIKPELYEYLDYIAIAH
jgi:LAGLIDADG DNA endonuclease family